MSNIVDAYYIRKRKLLKLNEFNLSNSDVHNIKYCAILSKNMKSNPTYDNISKFINECAVNSTISNTYNRECIEAVNEYGDKYPPIIDIVCDEIIPQLDDFILNDIREDSDMMQNEKIRDKVNSIYEMNTIADRTLSNHDKIMKSYDVESLVEDNNSEEFIIHKVVRIINEFDLPVEGKFSVALEELSYIYPTIDKELLVNEAYDYFCLACNPDNSIRNAMKNTVINSLVIPDSIRINESTKYNIYNGYIYSDNHDIKSLVEYKDKLLSSSSDHIKNNFNNFLELLTNIVANSSNKELVEYIYKTLIPGLKDEIINRLSGDPDGMTIMTAIRYAIQYNREICNDKYHVIYDANGTDIYQYLNSLGKLEEYIDNTRDLFYPTYNMECMIRPLNESVTTISLQEFKLFKFDNLITRLWKTDKWLQKKFNQFKNKVKAKICKVRSKIFENSDIYEFLDINGNIDYCISSFSYYPDADIMDLHEYCTSCIKEINRDIFGDNEYICYYEITGDSIEFRVRSNKMSIALTEAEYNILNESISYENMNRISDIILIGDLLDENFDFVKDSIKFFRKDSNRDKFGTYLELCSIAGIDKEVIKEVYYNSQILCNDPTAFTITNSYLYDSYKPMDDNLVEVSLQGIIGIQTLLEDGSNLSAAEKRKRTLQKKKEEQLRRWEEEEEDDDDNEESSDNNKEDNKKQEEKKSIPIVDKLKNNVKNNVNDIKNNVSKNMNKSTKEKIGDAVSKGMSFINKVKLYGHGLMQYAKTASNKIKSKVMGMNSSSNSLSQSIKSALISDNKEAIIKGSVIPSFHKCIAIAVGLAGLWAFNPPLAIISAVGGFAISKKLTMKERALMYDDIMIELKLVDKEIQMAESNDNIKKMRELMRIKKELERAAARIKLGSAGNKLAAGSTMFKQHEDD